jgi:hypothetical protein
MSCLTLEENYAAAMNFTHAKIAPDNRREEWGI